MASIHSYQRLKMHTVNLRTLPVLAVLLTFGACGGDVPPLAPATTEADNILFQRGMESLAEEDWERAREYFVLIRDNYPQSELRAESRLRVVETFEGEGGEISAAAALAELREFQRLYPPNHELGADAQFKVAMVYYGQMRRPERDQSQTRFAVSELELFITRYSETAEVEMLDEVRALLREARDRLSESSFLVGRFYYRNNFYNGAIDRFQSILEDDPGYTNKDVIYYHLADCFIELDRPDEALPLYQQLISEFPDTEYLAEANERISELSQQSQ